MGFQFSQDADNWFANVREKDPFRLKFDRYYICLMLGLASGRKGGPPGPDFVDYFVDQYKPTHRLISGLLTVAELKNQGIEMDDKPGVRKMIAELFDTSTTTGLSDEGLRNLNRYASGGFTYLAEICQKPHHADAFLVEYLSLLKSAADSSGNWN